MGLKILVGGDSVAAGWIPPTNDLPGYYTPRCASAIAADILSSRSKCGLVIIENVAVAGSTLNQWLNGGVANGNSIVSWDQRLSETNAEIVILQDGINSAFVSGVTVQGYMNDLMSIRNIALTHGKIPIFVTDNPISYSQQHNSVLWGLMNGARVCAAQMGMQVVDCNDAIARHVDNWPQFLPDKIHPDEVMHHFMGSLIAASLTRYIL